MIPEQPDTLIQCLEIAGGLSAEEWVRMAQWLWRRIRIVVPTALAVFGLVALVWLCFLRPGEVRNSADAELPEPVDAASIGHVPVAPGDNAFEFYRRASLLVEKMNPSAVEQHNDAALDGGWEAIGPDLRAWLEQHRQVLDLFRSGSECNQAVYCQPADLTLTTDMKVPQEMRQMVRLAQLESIRLLDAGDPDAAWQWCRAIIRASRHVGLHGAVLERLVGHAFHAVGCQQTLRWATDPRVDLRMLRTALDEIRSDYAQTAPMSRTLKIEYLLTLRTMRDQTITTQLIHDDFRGVAGDADTLRRLADEPAISIRSAKLAFANWIYYCDLPRPHRPTTVSGDFGLFQSKPEGPPGSQEIGPEEIDALLERTLLAKKMLSVVKIFIESGDRETAKQGLVELSLAAQCHYREYGAFPDTIQPLAETYFAELPIDPFGHGDPLHYRLEPAANGVTLWSIGPDEIDNDGKVNYFKLGYGDMIYHVTPPRPAAE